MNHRVRRSFLFAILVISVMRALVSAAVAQEPVEKDKPGDKGWSALTERTRLNTDGWAAHGSAAPVNHN